MLLDPTFREGFAALGAFGLVFDAWVYHPQLDEVADLAAAFPNTQIVLNHVGSPILGGPYAADRAKVFADWKAGMANLARHPNVTVKLGALPIRLPGVSTASKDNPPSSEEVAAAWRPWLETSIELFGADRCMFESNFPVQKRWCSYQVVWNAFKRLAANASAAEKAALFAGTAARVYGVPIAHDRLLRPHLATHDAAARGHPRIAIQHRTRRRHAAAEKFQFYIVQDALYLDQYARALAIAGARGPDSATLRAFGHYAIEAIAVEQALHERYLKEFGVNPDSLATAEPSPDCLGYTSFLMATAYHEPWEVLVAALLPCFWLYWDVGTTIAKTAAPDNPYRAWIDTYADDGFGEAVRAVIATTDQAAAAASDTVRDRMATAFIRSCQYEWLFWDGAWHRRFWPVSP